jgi:uncharacterized protein (TIRG00374 family)
MKKFAKNFITLFFLALGLIAAFVILRAYSFKEIIRVYTHFDGITLLMYGLVLTFLYIVLTYRWNVVLRARKIHIPFRKLFVYRIIGTSINFLTPGPRVGGEPTQANLLGKHGVEFNEGLSTVMIDKIIDTTTSGILFIIGAFLVGIKYSFPRDTEIALFVAGTLFMTLVVLFYYRMLTNRHFFLHIFHWLKLDKTKVRWIKRLETSVREIEIIMIDFYAYNKKAFIKCVAISIFTWVVMFFEYTYATKLIGFQLGLAELFFIITFIGMAQLFPIPMAVGVLEAGQISAFALIGWPTTAGVALAFLVRLKDIFISLIGLVLLAAYGFQVTKVVETQYKRKTQIIEKELRQTEKVMEKENALKHKADINENDFQ